MEDERFGKTTYVYILCEILLVLYVFFDEATN